MNAIVQSESSTGPRARRSVFVWSLWFAIGYCAVSCLTLPLAGRIWWGELPVLVLIQLPKIGIADLLRRHVVMEALPLFGLSEGSFSPDYIFARPYGLALVYLIPMVIIGVIGFRHPDRRRRFLTVAFLIAATTDYLFTLGFADGRFLTIY